MAGYYLELIAKLFQYFYNFKQDDVILSPQWNPEQVRYKNKMSTR
jgi:hypothetical protein